MAPSNNQPLIGYGLPLQEPRLYDVLIAWKTQLLISLNCVKIGSIETFSPATRTASVQVLFQRVMKDGSVSSYPRLLNCPVFTLQGGGASLQFPVSVGDTCLVLFSDRNLDNWYLNGNEQPPLDGRLHDLSDGIALVGLNWKTDDSIPAASTTEARLVDDTGLTKVGIESGKITVQNATANLGLVLANLTTALATLNGAIATMTTASIAASVPQGVAAANAAAITAVNTALAALLY